MIETGFSKVRSSRSLKAVYVENLDQLMKDLKELDPKLQREFRRELTKQVKPVAKLAQSFVPHKPFPGWRDVNPTYPPAWGWATDNDHRGRMYEGKSRWQWSQTEVIKGIRIGTAKTKVQRQKGATFSVTAIAVVNRSVPGIIYELAGFGTSKSRGRTRRVSRNPNASESFINKLEGTSTAYKEKRLIYRAAYQLGDQVNANLYKVLKQYLGEKFRG